MKETKLGNEAAREAISELLTRVPYESFGEKEIRLYVFGSTALGTGIVWSGVHGVVGRVLPCYAVTADGHPAFPDRWKASNKGVGALWVYNQSSKKYSKLTTCPACGK